MKRIALIVAGFATVALSVGVFPTGASAGTGNGAPSGSHYNLNIIGVPKGKSALLTGTSGKSIFVPLSGSCKIYLTPGIFSVLDRNCTDGRALFQLPAPGSYTIWARALGKPGHLATFKNCYLQLGSTYCATSLTLLRTKGQSKFQNVTTLLTTFTVNPSNTALVTACGGGTVSLFDPCLLQYFWKYTNNGLKLVQLRFYQSG